MPPEGQSRADLIRQVIARKERMFGGGATRRYNAKRSRENVMKGIKHPDSGRRRQPTMALLRWAASHETTDFEIMAALGNQAPDLGFLYYH